MFNDYYTGTSASYDAASRLDAADAKIVAERAKTAADEMKFEIERLLMITEALWDILKEKHGYSDEELLRRVSNIDLRDGKLDGRVAPSPRPPCPKCGRALSKTRVKCIYCGTPMERSPFGR